ncbi:hypothetical protein BDZ89DRAFT_301423 [Hymenopellis radicata]|nr:hypothetical protein BDZ89DRAFT_301423 [Hymenopellis radicata]
MRIVKGTRKIPNKGSYSITGASGALESIVNSLITDERVFHIDCDNWLDLINQQLQLEEGHYHPWPRHASPSQMMTQAPEKLKKEGWRSVRMALTMNIRFWIMRGFIAGVLLQEHARKFEFFKNAVTVLRWGAKTWAGVPAEDRGAIFEASFINGVRRLYLDAIMEHASASEEDRDVMLSLLATEARALIKDIEGNVPSEGHPVYIWSYHKNCWGAACASLGYYNLQMLAHASPNESKGLLRQAGTVIYKPLTVMQSTTNIIHGSCTVHCRI